MSTRRKLYLEEVKALLDPLRDKARALGFEQVGEWVQVGPDCEFIYHRPPGAKKASDLVRPIEGWVFQATPGSGCESALIGLCRFPGLQGWKLEEFCKTQYASRHGWEHFLKCHSGVVELLWAAERLGIRVKANDEGGLWETGSYKVLFENLEEYDRCIAAFGGALKEAAGDQAGEIEAPIFSHPRFEHLEAEGIAAHGTAVSRAVELVKQIADEAK